MALHESSPRMKTAWRITRITLGVLFLIAGTFAMLGSVAAAGAVAGVEGTVGRSGVVTQPFGSVASEPNEIAVIADGVTAEWVLPEEPEWVTTALALLGTDAETFVEDVGDFVFVVTPATDGDVFVGLAPVSEVDAYLDGTPYAVAVSSPERWPIISVPGEGGPSTEPTEAALWTTAVAGAPAEIPLAALDGSTLVFMNPDASAGVGASMRLEYRVPEATSTMERSAVTAAAGAVGGFLLILLGAFLLVGRRPRGRHA